MKGLRTVRIALAGLLLCSTAAFALAPKYELSELPELAPEIQHSKASKRITNTFTRSHYQKIAVDESMSEAIFDRFLQHLDYQKTILLQSDVDALAAYRDQMHVALKSGQLDAVYAIYDRYQKRRYERLSYALSLLDKPFDFTKDESYQYDREDASWPTSEAEVDELWRQRVKYEALNLRLAGKTDEQIKDLLGKRYNNALRRLVQTRSEDVFQTFMNAFARSIEPHTSYLSPRNADRFKSEMNLSLEGIGAVLQVSEDYTQIRSLVKGGPAEKSKQLAPEDKIVGVAQKGKPMVDVIGWRLDDVVELIKGPKGTEVRLEILPGNAGVDGKTKIVTLIRDKIRLEDRAAKLEIKTIEQGTYAGSKVGVIEIPGFYINLTEDVKALLKEMQSSDVKALLIDLRDNGGGSLDEATNLTGLFIDKGPVVQIRDDRGNIEVKADRDGVTYYNGPMTILVNRYSASASEIFAAALQDYGRALVIGEQTFGKGTVQKHKGLAHRHDLFMAPMGDVQYTIAKFYRISGGSTQNLGVTPDIFLPSELEPSEYGESTEDNALPWDQIARAQYNAVNDVEAPVDWLIKRHNHRIAEDPEFQYILADIQEYRAHKDVKVISLNEAKRKAEREAEEAKSLARENERRARLGLEKVDSLEAIENKEDKPEEDLYLQESLQITLDSISYQQIANNAG